MQRTSKKDWGADQIGVLSVFQKAIDTSIALGSLTKRPLFMDRTDQTCLMFSDLEKVCRFDMRGVLFRPNSKVAMSLKNYETDISETPLLAPKTSILGIRPKRCLEYSC